MVREIRGLLSVKEVIVHLLEALLELKLERDPRLELLLYLQIRGRFSLVARGNRGNLL